MTSAQLWFVFGCTCLIEKQIDSLKKIKKIIVINIFVRTSLFVSSIGYGRVKGWFSGNPIMFTHEFESSFIFLNRTRLRKDENQWTCYYWYGNGVRLNRNWFCRNITSVKCHYFVTFLLRVPFRFQFCLLKSRF